jgi:hypothetical protein
MVFGDRDGHVVLVYLPLAPHPRLEAVPQEDIITAVIVLQRTGKLGKSKTQNTKPGTRNTKQKTADLAEGHSSHLTHSHVLRNLR